MGLLTQVSRLGFQMMIRSPSKEAFDKALGILVADLDITAAQLEYVAQVLTLDRSGY